MDYEIGYFRKLDNNGWSWFPCKIASIDPSWHLLSKHGGIRCYCCFEGRPINAQGRWISVAVRKECKREWKTRLCEHCETRRPSCGHSSLCARFSCVHHGAWINQLSVPERTMGLPLAGVHYVDLVRANQNRPCQNQPKLKCLQSVIFVV